MKNKGKILIGIITVALFCLLFAVNVFAGEDVAIDATNFPDDNFRAYVSDNFDQNNDGFLQDSEISAVTRIDVAKKNITSLKGVEYFTKLTQLICKNNSLTSLDVSKNIELEYLWCSINPLEELNVSKNLALSILICEETSLTTIDVSKNLALQSFFVVKICLQAWM